MLDDAISRFAAIGHELALNVAPRSGAILNGGESADASWQGDAQIQDLLGRFGADAVRLAMAFAAPPGQSFEWSTHTVISASRWLGKFRQLVPSSPRDAGDAIEDSADPLRRIAHATIVEGAADLVCGFRLDRYVRRVMRLAMATRTVAEGTRASLSVREATAIAASMLYPVAPVVCGEMADEAGIRIFWPRVDANALAPVSIQLAIQVNGRLRGRVSSPPRVTREQAERLAGRSANVVKHLSGKTVTKVFYVPDKLINFVAL